MNAPLAAAQLPVAQDALWYKDAIIYQLHVKSFFDSNNDGIGDFPGLISKLDYIAELGVNTLWLLPFYPSPRLRRRLRHRRIPRRPSRVRHARRRQAASSTKPIARGIRVITELVINHTSDQHPWFQRARLAPPGSSERDFYVWSDNDQKYSGTRIIFVDSRAVELDLGSGRQRLLLAPLLLPPARPQLRQSRRAGGGAGRHALLARSRRRWPAARCRALPGRARGHQQREPARDPRGAASRIRAEIDTHYPGRMLLAEANQWPEDTKEYFGNGDECHMAFHFPLMPRMYMALAREDRFPITDIMRQTPQIPETCQWAIFLRNHDELTLEMVTDSERDYLWQTYATDRRARLNLGIRRRLAPLLERDRRRIELMNCLLFSMPGTPVIYYGDEIGMGDNIRLGDRDGVRTPMQWSPDRNGGFSRADPAALALPTIMDALYGYEIDQRRGPDARRPFAAALDAPHAGHPAHARRLRPRQPALPLSEEPQGPGLSARARRRGHPVRGQRLAHAAGGRTRPLGIRRPRSGRAERRLAVPADRPAHLSADPAALRLLLVHPDDGDRRAVVAHPGAGAVAGLCHRRVAQPARPGPGSRRAGAGTRDPAVLPAEAPLVRRQGPDAARRPHRLSGRRSAASATCCWRRSRSRPAAGPRAGSCRLSMCWEDEPSAALPSPACLGACSPRPARRLADRRLFARRSSPAACWRRWPTASASIRRRARSSSSPCRTRSRCCAARPTPRSCG